MATIGPSEEIIEEDEPITEKKEQGKIQRAEEPDPEPAAILGEEGATKNEGPVIEEVVGVIAAIKEIARNHDRGEIENGEDDPK